MKLLRSALLGIGLGTFGLAAILMVIGLMANLQMNQPKVVWRGLSAPISLSDAAQRAQARASQWAGDAALVRAEASWRPDDNWVKASQPAVSWSLGYYSPQQHALALVSVRGAEVLWVPPIEVTQVLTPLQAFPPRAGVDVAWLTFRGAGGDDFLKAHPDALVQFQLRQKETSMVWDVLAVKGDANWEVLIDAESGLLIQSGENRKP